VRQKPMPATVGLLGYGGLIPFVGLAILSIAESAHGIMYRGALLLYGAVILSFVGAIHWGAAMLAERLSDQTRRACFIWSVVPALIGWLTYILSPIAAALILVLGFLLQCWRDDVMAQSIHWPAWYLPLRIRLTIVACASLLIGVLLPQFVGPL